VRVLHTAIAPSLSRPRPRWRSRIRSRGKRGCPGRTSSWSAAAARCGWVDSRSCSLRSGGPPAYRNPSGASRRSRGPTSKPPAGKLAPRARDVDEAPMPAGVHSRAPRARRR
jgi:hypothetical protein